MHYWQFLCLYIASHTNRMESWELYGNSREHPRRKSLPWYHTQELQVQSWLPNMEMFLRAGARTALVGLVVSVWTLTFNHLPQNPLLSPLNMRYRICGQGAGSQTRKFARWPYDSKYVNDGGDDLRTARRDRETTHIYALCAWIRQFCLIISFQHSVCFESSSLCLELCHTQSVVTCTSWCHFY